MILIPKLACGFQLIVCTEGYQIWLGFVIGYLWLESVFLVTLISHILSNDLFDFMNFVFAKCLRCFLYNLRTSHDERLGLIIGSEFYFRMVIGCLNAQCSHCLSLTLEEILSLVWCLIHAAHVLFFFLKIDVFVHVAIQLRFNTLLSKYFQWLYNCWLSFYPHRYSCRFSAETIPLRRTCRALGLCFLEETHRSFFLKGLWILVPSRCTQNFWFSHV